MASQLFLSSEWIGQLLNQPTQADQISLLEGVGLWHSTGISRLLDQARELSRQNLGRAQQLAALCGELAELLLAPLVVARANYLQAQLHAMNGAFAVARGFVEAAQRQYLAQGELLAALRTNVGLTVILAEGGHYQEAIERGEATLKTIRERGADLDAVEARQVMGLVQQNLAICYHYMGQYEAAQRVLVQAEGIFQAFDMVQEQLAVVLSRGSLLLSVGRGSEALAAFEQGVRVATLLGNDVRLAQALNNVGHAQLLLGQYSQSLESLKEARRLFELLSGSVDRFILQGLLGDVYLALNLYGEAMAAYRVASDGLQGLPYQQGWVLWGLGVALTAVAQLDAAEAALAQAVTVFMEAENRPLVCSVMLEQAGVWMAKNQQGMALQVAQQGLQLVTADTWPLQRVYALLRVADLVLPDLVWVESLLLEAQSIIELLPLPPLRYRLQQRLGHLYLLQGRYAEAEAVLRAAVAEVERLRHTLAQEKIRASFLHDKMAAYEQLVQLYLIQGDEGSLQKALQVTEQAKSRTLADLLLGIVEAKLVLSADAEKQKRLQRLRADLNVIYNQTLQGGGEGERTVASRFLYDRAVDLEHEMSRLQLELSGEMVLPVEMDAVWPVPLLLASFAGEVVLLDYHVLGSEVMVFVYVNGRLQVKRHLATLAQIELLVQELNMEWQRFQADKAFVNRWLKHLQSSVEEVLYQLYTLLFEPIAALLPHRATKPLKLGVVVHDILHQVPFHALFDGKGYLIDRYEMVCAPSATLLAYYQEARPLRSGKTAVFGADDSLIPFVVTEAQTVADYLPQASVYIGTQATVAAFEAQAIDCGWLHLACHGLFRADNPMFSALRLNDGWLTAVDVLGLDLTNTFVILSACESGRQSGLHRDEILGLTRAFLGAGTRTLVVSLWLVEDEATAKLMASFYNHMGQTTDCATALRLAQLAIREQFPHPYYWAPFVMFGQTEVFSHN